MWPNTCCKCMRVLPPCVSICEVRGGLYVCVCVCLGVCVCVCLCVCLGACACDVCVWTRLCVRWVCSQVCVIDVCARASWYIVSESVIVWPWLWLNMCCV